MIRRYSSRQTPLNRLFLEEKLQNAKSYDRIAGYFSSSIFEVAAEAIESVSGKVRVICNSQVDKADCETATAAVSAQRREWCEHDPEKVFSAASPRLKRLYDFLKSGKLQVKVLPNDVFGLIHGKAGVITLSDGSKTSFVGSVNETLSAWRLNYELLWEDDSAEAVDWVQKEFDDLWEHPCAIALADFVIEDIERISQRQVVDDLSEWKQTADPAPVVVESPVNRRELGLWEHQKAFVEMAFQMHRKSFGARFVLADQVGLGKTVQLALCAQLMALWGEKPVLILVPKTLLWQWQDEMTHLLDMPSAVFTGKEWVDENAVRYPPTENICKCPRRVGILSHGLIVNGREEVAEQLLGMQYECVIVDEAHRARRSNLGEEKEHLKPEPNHLYDFLLKLSLRTHSMLLATATPVQMYPIEAWDLLNILSQKNNSVLGSEFSKWRKEPKKALAIVASGDQFREDWLEMCEWLRNPFPLAEEDAQSFGAIRKKWKLADDEFVIKPELIKANRDTPEGRKIRRILEDGFMQNQNPFIRHIVRRTREFLENNKDPETGEPYLKKIEVVLMGEKAEESLSLPAYLQDAYDCAEEFCTLLGSRAQSSGFMKTILLRRVGSTMIAGKNTAEKLLRWGELEEELYEEDEEFKKSEIKDLTPQEKDALTRFIRTLSEYKERDPKYELVSDLLFHKGFQEKGCILFSQYYDSANYVAENLSKEATQTDIGLYAGGDKSGIYREGKFQKRTKEEIKRMVKTRALKILVGTDAASEGLNLQTLGSLINIDLPWNPTRLEQRKGRIQRIGQQNDKIFIYNMRYKGSVEDRVHELLSKRLKNINTIFGQLPDVLEDVWIQVAIGKKAEAEKTIDAVPQRNPFEIKYEKQVVKHTHWEECSSIVLNEAEKRKALLKGWK